MDATKPIDLSDPGRLIDALDQTAIEERLQALEGERKALLTLLRASRARGKRRQAESEVRQ